MSGRASICFVAPNAYSALSGRGDVAHIGGAERQQVLLAKELVQRGYRVSFVVLDHGQPDAEDIHGIHVFKCYRVDVGMRGLRFFHPRLTGLWNAMKRADSDVYYQRGAESETGLAGHWCRRHTRGFIFSFANEMTCTLLSPFPATGPKERWLFRHGLRQADAVVAQTSRQQRILCETFGLSSTVIRSCCEWSPEVTRIAQSASYDPAPGPVLWVGRLSEVKRPDWVIRLAADLPECRFDLVGQSNVASQYGRTLAGQIQSLANIRWHGYVPHHLMKALYRECRLLLCTSESEGFPNVFLEAWAWGKPVLTSVDPDDVVAKFQLGYVETDYVALKRRLMASLSESAMWRAAGRRGQDYIREHHSTSAVVNALEGVVQRCHESVRARRAAATIASGP
ncbi:MAG: glycosyltransferase family 4 protein [Candidatus Rokubacteria bacterium]|nr:glycosyltransferase family 4 protein [Candidatus Rokubacteria bacterium]